MIAGQYSADAMRRINSAVRRVERMPTQLIPHMRRRNVSSPSSSNIYQGPFAVTQALDTDGNIRPWYIAIKAKDETNGYYAESIIEANGESFIMSPDQLLTTTNYDNLIYVYARVYKDAVAGCGEVGWVYDFFLSDRVFQSTVFYSYVVVAMFKFDTSGIISELCQVNMGNIKVVQYKAVPCKILGYNTLLGVYFAEIYSNGRTGSYEYGYVNVLQIAGAVALPAGTWVMAIPFMVSSTGGS